MRQMPSLFLHFIWGEIPYQVAFPSLLLSKRVSSSCPSARGGWVRRSQSLNGSKLLYLPCGLLVHSSPCFLLYFCDCCVSEEKESLCDCHEFMKNHIPFSFSHLGFKSQAKQLFAWGYWVFQWLRCSRTFCLVGALNSTTNTSQWAWTLTNVSFQIFYLAWVLRIASYLGRSKLEFGDKQEPQ